MAHRPVQHHADPPTWMFQLWPASHFFGLHLRSYLPRFDWL